MSRLKVGVIGGGSTYTPELIDGFLKRSEKLDVGEFVLMDVDARKLNIVGALVKRMVAKAGLECEVQLTEDLDNAITGADYVVTQFRVGGLEARARDESIPLKYGMIGQETTGPGGFMKAMRTIPVILDIAKRMERLAPKAWLINFTNPSGMITEAVSKYSNTPVVGLCNVPITTHNHIADFLGIERHRLSMDYLGLNHLAWLRGLAIDGRDRTEECFAKIMASGKMDQILGYNFNTRFLRSLNLLPTGYLQYYYHREEILHKQQSQTRSRAIEVMEIEEDILKIYQDVTIDEKPKLLEKRGGAWYSDAAVALISAIENNSQEVHIVNIANNGTIKGLPDDAVIEVPALVGADGAKPLTVGALPTGISGLMTSVKEYESLAVSAGAYGNKELAFQALASHPYCGSHQRIEELFEEMVAANAEYLTLV